MTTVTCTSCHRPMPSDARFCPSCGTANSHVPAVHDERRIATVAIGDIVGFTGLAETLDPEHVKRLVDDLFSRLAAEVTAHGGIVDKVIGDAIVALFGAPVAHEDDPERAVRAALAMQEVVAVVAQEVGLSLAMRFGVNTGEVLVGGLAADDSYTAMGDAVNVASRLESAAAPGAVLVGPDTHRATRDTILYRAHGRVGVRGRAEHVEAWTAVRPLGVPGTTPGRHRGPLVGRAAESAMLDAILDVAVARGRAHLVEIIGEPGVGKRQLAEDFVARARARHDPLVLRARIPPYGEASMWLPAAEMLRGAIGADVDLRDREALATVVAGVIGLPIEHERTRSLTAALSELFDSDPSDGQDVEAARASAAPAIVALLTHIAGERPIIAVLANIQWADAAIVELMTDVLIGIRRLPIVAITTARTDEETHDDIALEAVVQQVNATWLRLSPLAKDDAVELARSLLGPEASEEAVHAAVRRSGGNPLMLEEIAALATDDPEAPVQAMPLTLRGLVSARLDVLDPRARQLVEDAAMIGYSGSVALLSDIARARGETDTAGLLELMQDRDLFVVTDDTYAFKTDALREAAYLRLSKADRVVRHHDIGTRLGRGADEAEGTTVRRRAQHLATAAELAASMGQDDPGLVTEAVAALDRAAAWAAPRDPGVALGFADRAIALAPDLAWNAHLHRARALTDLARFDDARAAARAVIDADPDPGRRVTAMTVIGQTLQAQGRLKASEEVLTEAVAAARSAGDDHALALALRVLGLTLIFRGDDGAAEAAVTEAGEVYERLGDPNGVGWAAQHLGWVAFNGGDFGRARQLATDAMAQFADESDALGLAFTKGLLGWVDYMEGDLDGAMELATSAVGTGLSPERAGFGAGLAHVLIGGVHTWKGRAKAAAVEATEAIALLRQIGHRWGEMLAHLTRSRAQAHLGHPGEALESAETGLAIAEELGDEATQQFVSIVAAGVDLHLGEPDRAAARLPRRQPGHSSPDIERMWTLVALQRGDLESAQTHASASLGGPTSPGAELANAAVAAFVAGLRGRATETRALVHEVLDSAKATYQDRAMALLGEAFAALAEGNRTAVVDSLDRADAALAPAEDAPLRAVVDLARARLLGSAADVAAATGALRGAGITGDGWLTALAKLG